jgi:hypothetical protein
VLKKIITVSSLAFITTTATTNVIGVTARLITTATTATISL